MKQDCYIARSDYKHLIAEFEDLFNFYNTLISSGLLQNYIHENVLKEEEIQYFSETYDSIKDLKKNHSWSESIMSYILLRILSEKKIFGFYFEGV